MRRMSSFIEAAARISFLAGLAMIASPPSAEADPLAGEGIVVTAPDALPLAQRWLQDGGSPVRYVPFSDAVFLTEALYGRGVAPPGGGYGKIANVPIAFGNTPVSGSVNMFLGDPAGTRNLIASFAPFDARTAAVSDAFFQFHGIVALGRESSIAISHDDGFDLRLFLVGDSCDRACWLSRLEDETTRDLVFDAPSLPRFFSNAAFGPGRCEQQENLGDPACFQTFFPGGAVPGDWENDYFFVLSYYANGDGVSRLVTGVPEPATIGLLGLAAIGLARASRKDVKAAA